MIPGGMFPGSEDPERQARINECIQKLGETLRDTIRNSSSIARLMDRLREEGVAVSFNFCSINAEGLLDLAVDPSQGFGYPEGTHAGPGFGFDAGMGDGSAGDVRENDFTPEDREFLRRLGQHLS